MRRSMFECSMSKIERLTVCIQWIDLSFVERKRTPEWAIQVGIRCLLAGMSLRDDSNFLISWESSVATSLFTSGCRRQNYSRFRR